MFAKAATAALAFMIASCAITLHRVPASVAERRQDAEAGGSVIADAHAVEVHRFAGLTFSGSVTYISGSELPHSSPEPLSQIVLRERVAPSLEVSVMDQSTCMHSPFPFPQLFEAMNALYASDESFLLPADVELRFVAPGVEVKRQHTAISFGKRARLEFWFSCQLAHADENRLGAFLTMVHELTHATIEYYGGDEPADHGVEAEYVANGAPACLAEELNRLDSSELRAALDRLHFFERDPVINTYAPNADLAKECRAWRERMSRLRSSLR